MNEKIRLGIFPYVCMFCILTACILVVRNILLSENSADATPENLQLLSSEEWNEISNSTEQVTNDNSLIIYNKDDQNSLDIYENINYVLGTIGVKVTSIGIDEQRNYKDLSNFDTIVIILNNLEDLYYESSTLESYVSKGNGVFFTMPLQNNTTLQNYANLLGFENSEEITEIEYSSMVFTDDFLINIKDQIFYEDVINGTGLKVKLKDDVTIHATTADDETNPILWNVEFSGGRRLCKCLQCSPITK